MTQTVGFIGLGMMGHGMAKNLLAKGFGLRFVAHRNRTNLQDLIDAGAIEVSTREELLKGADVVIVCVTGTPQVEEIVYGTDGLLAASAKGLVVIDTSTAEPAAATGSRVRKHPNFLPAVSVLAHSRKACVRQYQGLGAD